MGTTRTAIDRAARGILVGLVACTPKGEPEVAAQQAPSVESPAIADAPAPVIPEAEVAAAPTCAPCVPRALASSSFPSRLALDATHVYWTADGTLVAASRIGGGSRELAHDVSGDSLALSTDAVFGCRRREDLDVAVVKVPKTGGERIDVATATECELAVVGDHLYFPLRERGLHKRLARLPLRGGEAELVGERTTVLSDIVGDATHVYWLEDGAIRRLPLAVRGAETFVAEARGRLGPMVLTATHVVWVQDTDVMRKAKVGSAKPERIANLQDVLDLASDGTRVFWASVADRRWVRYDPATATLETFAVPEGTSSIEVDDKTVVFNRFARTGRIDLVDTCGCGPDILVPEPAIREAEPPPDEFALVLGFAEDGRVKAQVSELSDDEMRTLDQLDGVVADEDLPQRHRRGTRYVATSLVGSSPAQVTGFDVGSGGSGTIYSIQFTGEPGVSGPVLLVREGGPRIEPLRPSAHDPEAARLVLPALRALAKAAGHRKAIGHKHVAVVRGRFPAPHAMLVALVVPVTGEEEPVEEYVAALWLADDAGRLTEEVIGIDRGLDRYDIELLVDVGADGVDEVLFSSSYYEGHFEHLLTWNGAKPEFTTLAGDGA